MGSQFKRGRTSVETDLCQARPKSATTPEIIEKIQDIVLENRRVTERDFVKAPTISLGSVENILTEVLGFRKQCEQLVPHSLTMQKNTFECDVLTNIYSVFEKKNRFITLGEIWFYHHDTESKQEAKQWC